MIDLNSTIKIEVQALTDGAEAKINSLLTNVNAKINSVNAATTVAATKSVSGMAALTENAAKTATTHIAGMSYYARSAIDGIRVALAGGGARAGFYAIDEAVRGLLASGLALSTLVPILAGIAAAVGGGVLVWREYTSAEREAEKATKDLHDKIKGTIELLKQMQDLQKSGLLSPEAVQRNRDILSGKISVFKNPETQGLFGPKDTIEQDSKLPPPAITSHTGLMALLPQMGPLAGLLPDKFEQLKGQDLVNYVQGKISVPSDKNAEGLDPEQTAAFAKLQELRDQIHARTLSQNDLEIQKIREKYEAERKEILDTAATSGAKLITPEQAQKNAEAIKESKEKEANEILAINRKVEEQQTKVNEEYAKGRAEFARQAEEKLNVELNESAAAQGRTRQQIYQEEYEKRVGLLIFLKTTGILTEQQYTDAVQEATTKRLEGYRREQEELRRVGALKEQIGQKDYDFQRKQIEQNPFLTKDEKDDEVLAINAKQQAEVSAALQANQAAIAQETNEQKLIGLLDQERQLREKLNGLILEQQKLSDQDGFINNLKSAWTDFYNKVSDTSKDLADVVVSPFEGMRNGIEQSLDSIMEKGGSLRQFFGSVAISIEKSFAQSFAKMAADWVTKMTMMLVQAVVTEIGISSIHQTESEKRRLTDFKEGMTGAWKAAVHSADAVASVPYAGPVLAVAAFATVLAALSAAALFKEGGYTGSGDPNEVAGLVHKGEFVVPADRVRQYGGGLLESIRNGSFSSGMAASISGNGATGGAQQIPTISNQIQHNIVVMESEAAARRWAEGEDGQTWFMSMLDKHIWKYQR